MSFIQAGRDVEPGPPESQGVNRHNEERRSPHSIAQRLKYNQTQGKGAGSEMEKTTVDIWGADDVLDTDHPARVLGQWSQNRSKTLLVLGHEGDGLIVVAATVAGRYVVSKAESASAQQFPTMMVEPQNAGRRRVPVGILYLGPPSEYAQAEIAKVFGAGARAISHADPEPADVAHVYPEGEPFTGPTSVYIGCVLDGPEILGPMTVAVAGMSRLFGPVIIPTEEQAAQAVSRLESGELAELVIPPLPEMAATA